MFCSRRWRWAHACRLSAAILSFAALGSATPALAAEVTGRIVDATGRAVPRAYVRILSGSGAETAAGFADEEGRFTLAAAPPCQIEATLAGFTTATAPCAEGPLRLVLAVAPISERVLVSATRTSAPAGQVGASATVFTAEDLERRQQPLVADLLVGTPGAALLRNGGPGTVTSLFVRGGESDYNKILLDGVPLNEPGGTYYLSNLTTENLDRIEIVRGAYSALFGSDAMASVIQLFTKRSPEPRRPQVTAQLDGGSYGTLHTSAAVNGATSRIDYSAAVARLDTDNRVENSAFENTTLSGTVGVAVAPNATLRFVGRGERAHVGTPGPTAFGRPDLDAFAERHDGVASLSFDQQISRRFRQRASYSLAASDQQSTNLLLDPPYTAMYQGRTGTYQSTDFRNDATNEYRRHHASYQADLHFTTAPARGDQTLTLLADYDGERVTAINRLTPSEAKNSRNNFGVSAQQQMLWRRLFVTIGGRVENNASFGTAFTPRGSVVYLLHQPSAGLGETRVKLSGGTGIKEPTLAESFSVSPYFLGNPDLDPERSRSLEIGIDQRFASDRAKIEVTYFDSHYRDVIQLITTNPATFEGQYFNTGATKARGVEFGVEVAPMAMLRARGGYTFLDGEVIESEVPGDIVFGLGNELFRRPRHSGSVGVTYTQGRVVADLNGAFVGRFVDSDFYLFFPSFAESPGHSIWDARVSVKISRAITGLLMLDNIGNADYSEPLGYQPLERAARVGVRVAF